MKLRNWWPALLWMSVIFATSCTVITSRQWVKAVTTRGPIRMPVAKFQGFWEDWWWLFVKGYHVLEFALLTVLILRPLRGRTQWAAFIAFAYASSDEFHQTFVNGRGGKWTDVAIDSIGISFVCVATLTAQAIQRRSTVASFPTTA